MVLAQLRNNIVRCSKRLRALFSAIKQPSKAKQSSVDSEAERFIFDLLRKTDNLQRPNINDLWYLLKDIDAVKMNVKNFGYQIARELQKNLPAIGDTTPIAHGLSSRPSRQSELASDWFRHWCGQLKIPVTYHRKNWEFGFLLQSLYDANLLQPGLKGLGFACGEEPIASYLASCGIAVTVTDLDPKTSKDLGWISTGQHMTSRDKAFHSALVQKDKFDELVSLRYVNMNDIPDDLGDYDFCWSICALEHLGSIEQGLDFICNSLKTVRKGGLAIHTTEFNYLCDNETIDNWPTVLFLRKHFEEVAARLEAEGNRRHRPGEQ